MNKTALKFIYAVFLYATNSFKALIKQKYLPVIMGFTISNNLLPESLVYMNK
jgi:hypothetical protein